ncbi:MAG: peptide ABC transporter substrate-binding protein [Firmicutes bacterium]|nr:peptide ABC transporter substrate-binding protein [Bacillota bacterium]
MKMNGLKRASAALSAGVGAAALLLVGMAPAGTANGASIVLPMPAFSSLDPALWGSQDVVDQGTVLEGLTGYNAKNQIIPVVAQRWTTSDQGRVWTFYLRHGLKWSNGQPVTAEDFYYSWMRTMSPQNTTSAIWASVVQYFLNEPEYHSGQVPASAVGVKVVNPYELTITLQYPHDILDDLAIAGSMPLYPPDLEAHQTNWFLPQYFVGNGPFVIKSFVINGQVTLGRNPYYKPVPGQQPLGNVSTVIMDPTPSVPVEDYEANRLNAAVIINPSDYRYVLNDAKLKADLHSAPNTQLGFLEWNKSPEASPLDNLAVRQAISMAINRAPLVNPVQSGMARVSDIFGFPGWPTDSGQTPLKYDVAKARKLLANAGYPGGKGLPVMALDTPPVASNAIDVNVAEAVQQELKQELGVRFKIVQLPSTTYGDVAWQGVTAGILPGYVIAQGSANWVGASTLNLKGQQDLFQPGNLGPLAYRDHIANYYTQPYDLHDIQMWGNPNDASMGVKLSQWAPLTKSAEADIKWLAGFDAKQPAGFRIALEPPGTPTNQQIWNGYIADWHKATTASAKHAVWVAAWKFVGNWETGNDLANLGLNGQVYEYKYMPASLLHANQWDTEALTTSSQKQVVRYTENVDNYMMDQGYAIPLYSGETFYLENPSLSGLQTNPYGFGPGFWQFASVSMK